MTRRSYMNRLTILTVGLVILGQAAMAQPASGDKKASPKVVFVCEHGSAKSVMAAAEFERLAKQKGLAFQVLSRGANPDAEIDAPIRQHLLADGMNIGPAKPAKVSEKDLQGATRVISFGPELAPLLPNGMKALDWSACRRRIRTIGLRASISSNSWMLLFLRCKSLSTLSECGGTRTGAPVCGRHLGGLPFLAEARLHQFWWAGRTDRHHASGVGGTKALDLRTPLSARTQLLHGASGTGSATTGHLYWMAHAPVTGRHRRRSPICPAVALHSDRLVVDRCGLWAHAHRVGTLLRHQTCRHGDRDSSRPSYRIAGIEKRPAVDHCGRIIPRDLCAQCPVPRHRLFCRTCRIHWRTDRAIKIPSGRWARKGRQICWPCAD